jgi:hypothetical protein
MAAPFDDLTARRIAENEATFRHANEQIEDAAVDHRVRRPPFICECADPGARNCSSSSLANTKPSGRARSRSSSRRGTNAPTARTSA